MCITEIHYSQIVKTQNKKTILNTTSNKQLVHIQGILYKNNSQFLISNQGGQRAYSVLKGKNKLSTTNSILDKLSFKNEGELGRLGGSMG